MLTFFPQNWVPTKIGTNKVFLKIIVLSFSFGKQFSWEFGFPLLLSFASGTFIYTFYDDDCHC